MTQATSAKHAFTKDVLDAIAVKIGEAERATHAEIRISIRDVRDAAEADLSVRDMTVREFAELRMHQTTERNGILLLILFAERQFYIFGDEGISRHIDTSKWENVAETLRSHFKTGEYQQGIIAALEKIERHLVGVLPERTSSNNELSDEVVVR